MSTEVRRRTSIDNLSKHANACTTVLQKLGKTWSVAESARVKFEKLVSHTTENLRPDPRYDAASASHADVPAQHNDLQATKNIETAYPGANGAASDGQFQSSWDDLLSGGNLPGPDMIMDELGDMSTWFDLDWLGDINYANISWP